MSLGQIVERFRRPGKHSPRRFISTWTEKELLNGVVVDCYVVVLRTKGCYWSRISGCSMCGYINDCAEDASSVDVFQQFEDAMKAYSDQDYLKIYTSGSYLDEQEIGREASLDILKLALSRVERVLIESRPEFVSKGRLKNLPDLDRIEIALGLESSNDVVLQRSINKRMTFEDFEKGCGICRELGTKARAYILIKPPFLTEKESMMDAISTARAASGFVDTLSFNPVNVQRNTLVDYLWKRGEYRPPWLWTVVKVAEATKNLGPRVLVSTTGAGSRRGAHNCGDCDFAIIDFLRSFSLDPDLNPPDPACQCREEWLDLLDVHGPMQASADPAHFYDR